ncbi:MAG: efflux RND transporter permease subunit [Lachnospiraceae bacterium]|nr:efflux RND transporter permease subunit [Lachnospiraceae bacterium]
MEKYSVRRPFTVLVAVIAVIALGVISVTRMPMDLLPQMSLPYLIVITTYPGASPEKVEADISEPLEDALGTVTNVQNVYSVSSENYSLVELEFQDGTNMDSVMVKVSSALDQISSSLPDTAQPPVVLEISMDMVATMYIAVERDGYDIYELSDYIEDDFVPYIEREDGVASVTNVGIVDKKVQVELNQRKIDDLNDRILSKTNKALEDARKALADAQKKVDDGQEELERQEKSFGETLASGLFGAFTGNADELSASLKDQITDTINQLNDLANVLDAINAEVDYTMALAADDVANAFYGASGKIVNAYYAALNAQSVYEAVANELTVSLSQIQPELTAAVTEAQVAVGNAGAALQEALDAYNELVYVAQEAGGAITPEMQAELVAAIQKVLAAGDDYTAAQLAYAQLIQTLMQSSAVIMPEVPRLQEDFNKAAADANAAGADVSAAAMDLQTILGNAGIAIGQDLAGIDMGHIYDQLDYARTGLTDALSLFDGSSISSLMSAVTRVADLIPQIYSLLGNVMQVDTTGTSGDVVSDIQNGLVDLQGMVDRIPELLQGLESAFASLTQGQLDAAVAFSTATTQLANGQTQLESARKQYESARETALKNANADALLKASTLSQMIYAQNFSMPAGYIDDANDESWMLRVGDEFASSQDIADALLVDMDEIGTVRLSDVADVTIIDNANLSYAKLNGEQAVILCIYKGSSAGTNEVSRGVREALGELEARDTGVHVSMMMDQGSYITLIVNDILKNMGLGAILAIIILAVFLRDVRPTILVALSIPLSVLFAIVLMYFTGLSLNIMTLSGLSLGIGMLVDNSIVVIENVFRLRGKGMTAPRAAVQGAKQVAGAIASSTLTTICVFFPMVFTTGTVRELLVPMGLSISYCLLASLVVAMTVVPAAASSVFRTMSAKKNKAIERVQEVYERTLRWCLRHKLASLAAAIVLLAVCIIRLVTMGIVVIPEINGDDIQVTVTTPEEDSREASYEKAGQVMEVIMGIDGVGDVGVMDSSSTTGLITSFSSSSDDYGSYICYVTPETGAFSSKMTDLVERIEKATSHIDAEIEVSTGGMSDMSSMMASGLSINIYGNDLGTLKDISEEVMEYVGQVKGFDNISNGSEDSEKALHLVIDKDKAMSYGLTVAQIYAEISQRLTTSVKSTTITSGGKNLEVVIKDETKTLTKENILDMEFDTSQSAAMMQGASSMGTSGSGGMSSGMDASAFASMLGGDDDEDDEEEEKEEETTHYLREFATLRETTALSSVNRKNLTRYITVKADTLEGYNTELLTRELKKKMRGYKPPNGFRVELEGENTEIRKMVTQMTELMAVALLFIYLVMVAQFQSLLSPFIVLFTIPLAFTGGMLGLILAGEQLSMLSLMGFLILMGTVVNNGIVFVDYANQLRIGGLAREDALVATGMTRMRPILMTALTTILAMSNMIIGGGMGSQLGRGMAIVIAGGLIYATFMTLYVIPIMYDILFKRPPLVVDVGDDLDDAPDDAEEFLRELERRRKAEDADEDSEEGVDEEGDIDFGDA